MFSKKSLNFWLKKFCRLLQIAGLVVDFLVMVTKNLKLRVIDAESKYALIVVLFN